MCLIDCFQRKIGEAVSLVQSMSTEEKLKAVQFWNNVSENLQGIVNSSANDIYALAKQICERDGFTGSPADRLNSNECRDASQGSCSQTMPNLVAAPSSYHMAGGSSSREPFLLYPGQCSSSLPELHFDKQSAGLASLSSDDFSHLLTGSVDPMASKESPAAMGAAVDDDIEQASNGRDLFDVHFSPLDGRNSKEDSDESDSLNRSSMLKTPDCVQDTIPDFMSAMEATAGSDVDAAGFGVEPHDWPSGHILPELNSIDLPKHTHTAVGGAISAARACRESATSAVHADGSGPATDSSASSPSVGVIGLVDMPETPPTSDMDGPKQVDDFTRQPVTSEKGKLKRYVYRCNLCGVIFLTLRSFYVHFSQHSSRSICPECGLSFTQRSEMKVHCQSAHRPNGGVNSCAICQRQFSSSSNLKRHMLKHSGERPFLCDLCPKRFAEKKSLQVHFRLHSGERPYACTLCPARFKQQGNLDSHQEGHQGLRPHLCDLCGKRFRQQAQLRLHKLRHEDKKAFKCEQCPMAFNVANDLMRHKRSHLDHKPFKCDVCEKTFCRSEALNEHLNRHFGYKPFACPYCPRTFPDLSSCHRHIKKHKADEASESTQSDKDAPIVTYPQISSL